MADDKELEFDDGAPFVPPDESESLAAPDRIVPGDVDQAAEKPVESEFAPSTPVEMPGVAPSEIARPSLGEIKAAIDDAAGNTGNVDHTSQAAINDSLGFELPTVVPTDQPLAAVPMPDVSALPSNRDAVEPAPPLNLPRAFIGYRPGAAGAQQTPGATIAVDRPGEASAGSVQKLASPTRKREQEIPIDPPVEPDPVDQVFPPEMVNARGAAASATVTAPAPPTESVGKAMPRVQVMVTLANAQALFTAALEAATQNTSPRFQSLARLEVNQAEFDRKSVARAVDPRLRGSS